MKITVFSDYVCPFCYIGIETLRAVESQVPAFTLEWKGFQIHPEWPATGMPIERRMEQFGRERYQALWQNIRTLATNIGLYMQPPPLLTNSLMALEATEYAKTQGKEQEFSRAVFRAYFQEGKNIGDIDILLSVAAGVGLNPGEVQDHLKARTYAARIAAASEEAGMLGITGVPTFVIGEAQIVGAQGPEVFVRLLNRVAERQLA